MNSTDESIARRPIAARQTTWAPAIARFAVSIGLTPNQVSLLSVLASLLAAVLLGTSSHVDSIVLRALLLLAAAIAFNCGCSAISPMA